MKKLPVLWFGVVPLIVAVGPGTQAPAPLPAGCPAVADPTTLIAGLQTGHALTDGATTTLRFSSDVRACNEWTNDTKADCLDHWNFQISIPGDALVPGTYDLADLGASFGDLVARGATIDKGCEHRCGGGVTGIGSIAIEDGEAVVIVDSVADGCITGTIRGLRDPHFKDTPDFNGAFFAVRCAP